VSLWFLKLTTGVFFYEVAKGVKNPYIPYRGGRFYVHCDLTPSPDPKSRRTQTAVSYMEYFSDVDLEAMREVQDRVIRKIVAQKPPGEFDRWMLEAGNPLRQMEIGSPFNRNAVLTIPYLDADDVSAWGAVLASRLEQTVVGVRERPVFFMREDSGQLGAAPNGSPASPLGNSGASDGSPSVNR
jgi:hypothetical protein